MSSRIFVNQSKQREKQRKARKEIVSFLRKFENSKKKIKNTEDWYDSVKELEPILDRHKDALPQEVYAKLKDSIQLTDKTFEGINTATKVLGFELKSANAILSTVGGSSSAVIGASVVIAVVVGSIVVVSSIVFAEITITNYECEDIPVLAPLVRLDERFSNLGLLFDLPDKISTNTSEIIRIPSGNIEFDGLTPGKIIVGSNGITMPFDIPSTIKSLDFDGANLLGQQSTVKISGDSDYKLIINCR